MLLLFEYGIQSGLSIFYENKYLNSAYKLSNVQQALVDMIVQFYYGV